MLQSNKLNLQDFNLIWSKHAMERPPSWNHWSDQFKLVKITEENMVNLEQEVFVFGWTFQDSYEVFVFGLKSIY